MAADFIQHIWVYISAFSAQAVRLILINYDFESFVLSLIFPSEVDA